MFILPIDTVYPLAQKVYKNDHVRSHPSITLELFPIETKLIWLQNRVLQKSRKTNAVTVEDIPVWFVHKGRMVFTMGEERTVAESGDWMFPRQGDGWVHVMPNSKILSLRFRLRWPNGQDVYRRQQTLVLPAKKWPALSQAAQKLVAHLSDEPLWFADRWWPGSSSEYFGVQAHFQGWLSAYGKVMEAHGSAMEMVDELSAPALKARRVLMDWDLAKPFSRKMLSRQLGVSTATLSRRFIAYYGTTPRGFLEQRKLSWARQRLTQGDERIKVIAAELGFVNLAQFSNWFRVRNQLSPRDYRHFAQKNS